MKSIHQGGQHADSAVVRATLLQRRDALVGEIAGRERKTIHSVGEPAGREPGERGETANEVELEVDLAEIDREGRELEEINAAIAAIDAGTYGVCAECEKPIGQARLSVQPEALYCIACAASKESATNVAARQR